ncbi:MAG: TolC family protein [Kangiellaceae bacterium]|nr:TolC family protein [Kangiellaceae bacterium]
MTILKNTKMNLRYIQLSVLTSLSVMLSFSVHAEVIETKLSLDLAIEQAQQNDPWIAENKLMQQALDSKSIAVGALPDPVASVSLLNMPIDGYDFNQENMTQLKMGISQMFPRGDTLRLQTQKLQRLNEQNPYLRLDRKAQIAVRVATLWFDVFNAKESIRLIEQDRDLFEQLLEISTASYSTAFGGTQQQDVVRAQLELTRLDDRLTKLKQKQDVAQKKLGQWVSGQFAGQYTTQTDYSAIDINSQSLPDLVMRSPELLDIDDSELSEKLASYLVRHPSVLALESRIQASETDVELSRQKYKPQWGLNAAYSYRADTPSGRSRADFLSLGINFDLPLFTENKQDKYLQASVSESEAIKTQKWLLLRKMIADFQANKVQLHRLEQRSQLYEKELLPKIREQAEAALTAYTNDEGDFAEVVRARIDVLDAEIDNLGINVDSQKTISQLNYYLETNK